MRDRRAIYALIGLIGVVSAAAVALQRAEAAAASLPRIQLRQLGLLQGELLLLRRDRPVHFLRFELPQAARDAVRAGASVRVGCDHTNYPAGTEIGQETLASLAADRR